MTGFQYKRAPILEAVVEFRFAAPVDDRKRQKAVKKLRKGYADHSPVTQKNFEFKINSDGTSDTRTIDSVIDKFSSIDITQQLHVSDMTFLASQLAPYTGWEGLSSRFKRDWDLWSNIVGFQKIERIGVRYINRIDLPVVDSLVHYEDYVNVYPTIPDSLNPSLNHSVHVRVLLKEIESELNLKSAVVESPLPNHLAIVIDLDIGRMFRESPSYQDLYAFMGKARIEKNKIFEACITEKARELFSQ